jgi:hypothetical protein
MRYAPHGQSGGRGGRKASRARERRQDRRYLIGTAATLWHRGEAFDCTVVDISAGGALVEVGIRPEAGQRVRLHVPHWGSFEAEVKRRDGRHLALAFAPEKGAGLER